MQRLLFSRESFKCQLFFNLLTCFAFTGISLFLIYNFLFVVPFLGYSLHGSFLVLLENQVVGFSCLLVRLGDQAFFALLLS